MTQFFRRLAFSLALALAAAPACAEDIRILGVGAVQHSVLELAKNFERDTGHKISTSFGTAGAVNAKIEAGEPADVVFSGAPGLQGLAAKGLLDETGVKALGTVRIAVGVKTGAARPDISSLAAFKAAMLAAPAFAYADPASGATSGIFFAKKLGDIGIADAVAGKAVLRNGGLNVMAAVAEGKAAFGITQASEVLASPGIDMVGYIPGELQLASAYAVAVTRGAKARDAARAFVAYASGEAAFALLQRDGFDKTR